MSTIESMKKMVSDQSGIRDYFRKDRVLGYLSISPTLAILLVVVVIPVAFATWASLHDIHALDPNWTFLGIENYWLILEAPAFYTAIRNGLVYTVGSVAVQVVVGVGVALMLNSVRSRILTAFTLSLYLIPSAVITLAAREMFSEQTGIIYKIIRDLGLISSGFNFWADGTITMGLVILIGSYKFAVFVTLMVLARLQSIPKSYYEAAQINGATTIQMFRDVTWPAIRGVVAIVVLLRGIWMFNNFDVIWILTKGGPGEATMTLPIYAYRTMFENYAYGLASGIAVVMFLILVVGGILYFTLFSPEEEVATA